MIPAHRQAISGRTWSQRWEPRAVEIHRRPRLLTDRTFCLLVALAGSVGLFFSTLGI